MCYDGPPPAHDTQQRPAALPSLLQHPRSTPQPARPHVPSRPRFWRLFHPWWSSSSLEDDAKRLPNMLLLLWLLVPAVLRGAGACSCSLPVGAVGACIGGIQRPPVINGERTGNRSTGASHFLRGCGPRRQPLQGAAAPEQRRRRAGRGGGPQREASFLGESSSDYLLDRSEPLNAHNRRDGLVRRTSKRPKSGTQNQTQPRSSQPICKNRLLLFAFWFVVVGSVNPKCTRSPEPFLLRIDYLFGPDRAGAATPHSAPPSCHLLPFSLPPSPLHADGHRRLNTRHGPPPEHIRVKGKERSTERGEDPPGPGPPAHAPSHRSCPPPLLPVFFYIHLLPRPPSAQAT